MQAIFKFEDSLITSRSCVCSSLESSLPSKETAIVTFPKNFVAAVSFSASCDLISSKEVSSSITITIPYLFPLIIKEFFFMLSPFQNTYRSTYCVPSEVCFAGPSELPACICSKVIFPK